jgi:hypothetical protein
MQRASPFDEILQSIASARGYALGDFLMDLFCDTGRSERHGKMLGAFLRGTTTFGVGDVLKQLDTVAGQFENREEEDYSLEHLYKSLKCGHTALTAYAAQKVHQRLSVEQRAAVDPESGLHVFAPRKKTDPVNLRLSWDTYGASTFADVQTLLMKYQPLTFNYLKCLATSECRDPTKEHRYRPPDFVCNILISHIISLTHDRSQHKRCLNSTSRTIETQRGCKFSMEFYSWLMEQHKPSSTTQADYAWRQATAICLTSSGS